MVTKTPPSRFNVANRERTKLRSTQFIDNDDSTLYLGIGQGFFRYLNTLFCPVLRKKSRTVYAGRDRKPLFQLQQDRSSS